MYTKKTKGPRLLLAALALVLVFCCSVGGTLAWLTAKTDSVVNTFTVGDINISLYESPYNQETNKLEDPKSEADLVTKNTYKIIPGMDMPKNPRVTVKKGSEPCWVFLKVEEINFINGISYKIDWKYIDDYWHKLDSEENIYYFQFFGDYVSLDANGALSRDSKSGYILEYNKITVSGDITKEQLDSIRDKEVSLNFTAYAIQYDGFPTVQEAWEQINATYKITTSAASGE